MNTILSSGILALLLSCSPQFLMRKASVSHSKMVGVYSKSDTRKGVDIPDYAQYSILTLNEDSTFQLKNGGSEFEENTTLGKWKQSSDTLLLIISMNENAIGNLILYYKINNSKSLFKLPLIRDGTPLT